VDYGRAALFLGLGYFSGASFNRYIINFIKPLKAALVALISNIVLSLLMLALSVFFQINLWIILLPVFAMFFFCGLIVPNMISSTVTLYKQSGGTVNAVFGSLTASGAFLMISIASLFKAQSQVPMAILYAAIAVLSLFLFAIIQKVRKH